jgi:ABC-type sugar transport system substrate-binding protein
MKNYTKWLAAALFAATLPLAPSAAAAGVVQVAPVVPDTSVPVITVQSSCNAVGQQQAAQNGGTLASVNAENRGGQTWCVGVVIVPAKDGERGRRIPFEVPL